MPAKTNHIIAVVIVFEVVAMLETVFLSLGCVEVTCLTAAALPHHSAAPGRGVALIFHAPRICLLAQLVHWMISVVVVIWRVNWEYCSYPQEI